MSQQPNPSTSPSTLADLGAGEQGIVACVTGEDALAERLVDQGMWKGVAVRRIAHALGGDPILFALHGYRIALRVDEARRVQIDARASA